MDSEKKELVDMGKERLSEDNDEQMCSHRTLPCGFIKKSPEPFALLYQIAAWMTLIINPLYINYRVAKDSPLTQYPEIYQELQQGKTCADNVTYNDINITQTGQNITYSDISNIEEQVKKTASEWVLSMNLCIRLTSVISGVCWSSFSDIVGRKKILILQPAGSIMAVLIYIMMEKYSLPLYWTTVASVIEGLGGWITTQENVLFAYMADTVSDEQMKFFRFSFLEATLALSGVFGSPLSGYLVSSQGYYFTYLIVLFIFITSLVYLLAILSESLDVNNRRPSTQIISGILNSTIHSFHIYMQSTLARNDKKICILLLITTGIIGLTTGGLITMETIYVIGHPFCMDSQQVGGFLTLMSIGQVVGSTAYTSLLKLCLTDTMILIKCSVMCFAAFLIEALARVTAMLYLGE